MVVSFTWLVKYQDIHFNNCLFPSRIIVVQSEAVIEDADATLDQEETTANSLHDNQGYNLYILAGHEAMQL